MLTGLSLAKFGDGLVSIHTIEDMFRQQVVDETMEKWVTSTFQGHPSIDIGNRYFTPRNHALQNREVSFNQIVDPDNILSNAMREEFVHTEDNEVEYYEARKNSNRIK